MINYLYSPIDDTLEAYADDKWDASAVNYVIINDIKAKSYYNHDYNRMFDSITNASFFPTLYDAKLVLSDEKTLVDDNKFYYDKLCIKPYYPWNKLYSLCIFISKIIGPDIKNGIKRDWTIAMSDYIHSIYFNNRNLNDNKWELGSNSTVFRILCRASLPYTDALNDAKLHGILLDEEDTVIGVDWDQFNKTKYLWQMKDIGLL